MFHLFRKNCPCKKCRNTPLPLYMTTLQSELSYGVVKYADVREKVIIGLEKDIPHPDCRDALLRAWDKAYDYALPDN